MSFTEQLSFGREGERIVADFARANGARLIPAGDMQHGDGKSPRIFGPSGEEIISPDLLCFSNQTARWLEVKRKRQFVYHRIKGCWQTGIDLSKWNAYRRVAAGTELPVLLFFLHEPGAVDNPSGLHSPDGLFANSIKHLSSSVDHEHGQMIYWRIESLIRLGAYTEIIKRQRVRDFGAMLELIIGAKSIGPISFVSEQATLPLVF
jgi:hypothetical protein